MPVKTTTYEEWKDKVLTKFKDATFLSDYNSGKNVKEDGDVAYNDGRVAGEWMSDSSNYVN